MSVQDWQVSTLSRPKAADVPLLKTVLFQMFQHSAARRRLTGSLTRAIMVDGFNTQPPEGG